jgi:type V secretory pathway adhesin AidA
VTYTQDEVLHFVAMVESSTTGSSRVTIWRNGVPLNVNIPAGMNLSDIQDVNTWIGRSNYLSDSNLQGTVEEFRIYNGLLSPAQIAKNIADGPDAAITPTPPTTADFQITAVTAAPGQQLSITFPTKVGKTYQVETSTSMTATTWSNLGAAVTGTGSPATVTDTVNGVPSTVHGRRFYRVKES